jgi:PAS domain S-box-containing protein
MSPEDELLLRAEMDALRTRFDELRARVREPEEIVRAIRENEVDALVVAHPDGERIYTLRNAESLYRAIVEEMNEGAAVIDSAADVVYCNPRFAALLGVQRDEVVGASALAFFDDESRSFFDYVRQEPRDGVRRELTLVAADGESVPVAASVSRIHLEDQDVFGLVLTDLREQRQRQELLAQNMLRNEFLAMLAHELRNPLTPISNAVELLGVEKSESSVEAQRQLIERQVRHLTRLLDDLLDVQRFTHGVIGLKTERTEVVRVVEAAIEAIRPSADAKQQTLQLERGSETLWVMADATRLTQIVSNLLVNAVKYSPKGSTIRMACGREGPDACIRVADDGIGMTPELLQHVFEPFVQGSRDLARAQGGLGLGLTLVKRLVELHGGSVRATSAGPGHGSEFRVSVPLVGAPARAGERAPAGGVRAPHAPPRRVLVVDDNVDAAASLSALLRFAGHEVEFVHDGVAALDAASRFRPAAVLLDIGLPGMDGFEIARQLRTLEGLARCHIIALTGYGRSEDRRRTRDAGFSAHLVKPVEYGALLEALALLTADDASRPVA